MENEEILLSVAEVGSTADLVPVTTLQEAGLFERAHLQEWVVAHPGILGEGVIVATVEYDAFVVGGDAKRDRLDVLGLDRDGRLVVAELKRGTAPDTVDLQAVKYGAMVSRFRPETLAAAHAAYKMRRGTPMTVDQALEALEAHAPTLTEETLADPRLVIVAQGFGPVVISSVRWLAKRGVDITLVRFQPYRSSEGRLLVTFSRLFPLRDLEKTTVAPGTPTAELSTDQLPVVEWTRADLVALGRIANATTRMTLDLCAASADMPVSLTDIVGAAGVSRPAGRAQLAGLTIVIKHRFARSNWPFATRWAADGSQQAFYSMPPSTAELWRLAANDLEIEQSNGSGNEQQTAAPT